MWLLFLALSALAEPHSGFLCYDNDSCNSRGAITSRKAGPTKSDSIKINPAAVPVEKTTGVEAIYYKGSFDVGLVKGLGRVGAAISPTNNDETFFGAPAPELFNDFIDRHDMRDKYSSGKYNLAGAVALISQDGEGFSNFHVNLGLMARYESFSKHVKPGAGLQVIAGPLYGGYSYLQDENRLDSTTWLTTTVQSFGLGLSLNSVLVDYSVLHVDGDFAASAQVATVAVFVSRFILTAARRETRSEQKLFYDFSLNQPLFVTSQVDYFGGVQAKVAPWFILGIFYNYYLLHEASLGATLFF